MSNLSMTQAEEKALDSKLEQDVLNWAKTRQAEAEQLAMDSARLMACTTDRLDKLKNQGFFKRCWSRFSGEAGAMERANVNDLIQMQKMSFRYVNMLQEQQLLMAHSLLSLKNNLNSFAIREEQTRQMVGLLAERTRERFEKLEKRVDQLEVTQNLQGWVLSLEEREYDTKYPTEYMRLFRVINDFYRIKNDNWNYQDLLFMRTALRKVKLDHIRSLPIGIFLNSLIDEVQRLQNGYETYRLAISEHAPASIQNYSQFAIENISSPVFLTLHGINTHYADKMEAIEALQESLSVSKMEALKVLLRTSIKNLNVNLDYEFPLAETAIEILGCMRLSKHLEEKIRENSKYSAQATHENFNTSENISSQENDANTPLDVFIQIVNRLNCIDPVTIANSSFRFSHGKSLGKFPSHTQDLLSKLDIEPTRDNYTILSDGTIGIIIHNKTDSSDDLIPFDLDNKLFAKLSEDEIVTPEGKEIDSSKEAIRSVFVFMLARTIQKLDEKQENKSSSTDDSKSNINPTAYAMGAMLGSLGLFGAFLNNMNKNDK